MLVLVCYKARDERERDLRRYWLPKGCIKQWYDKPTGSNEAVTLLYLVPWSGILTYRVKTQDLIHYDSHHWSDFPFTWQITVCFFYCSSGLLEFCQTVQLLTYIFATKVCICHELDPWHIVHVLVSLLQTSNLSPLWLWQLLQAWIWVWADVGQCLIFIQIRHMVRLFEFECECTLMRRSLEI